MKFIQSTIVPLAASLTLTASAQTPSPQTEADLAKETALLKAQQTYYDQLAATAKSQQAAADANTAAQTASLTAATALQNAQYTGDLAQAAALKGSGLSAATGKDGSIAIAATEKGFIALQRDSLQIVETLSTKVCSQLRAKLVQPGAAPQKAFIAPANYELLVQKSVVDIIQFVQLHDQALKGMADFDAANMQVGLTALAGAMVSAQHIAGGIQSLTKLFRTDYNLSFTPANRQGLFEQALAVSCKDVVVGNLEARLRLNAAEILRLWLPDMAKFSQRYDMWSERTTVRKAALTAQRTAVAAMKPAQTSTLSQIDAQLAGLEKQEEILAKYKAIATAMKTYLGAMGAGTIYESLVWGQDQVHATGALPVAMTNFKVPELHRISYSLNIQDASIKATSTFSADKLRYFATAELYYALTSPAGEPVALNVMSMSTEPTQIEIKAIKGVPYDKQY